MTKDETPSPKVMMGLVGDLLGTHLEVSGELVVRSLTWSDNLPQVWGEEFVGLGDSSEGSLQDCMTERKREGNSVDCLNSNSISTSIMIYSQLPWVAVEPLD